MKPNSSNIQTIELRHRLWMRNLNIWSVHFAVSLFSFTLEWLLFHSKNASLTLFFFFCLKLCVYVEKDKKWWTPFQKLGVFFSWDRCAISPPCIFSFYCFVSLVTGGTTTTPRANAYRVNEAFSKPILFFFLILIFFFQKQHGRSLVFIQREMWSDIVHFFLSTSLHNTNGFFFF